MNHLLRRMGNAAALYGVDLRRVVTSVAAIPFFVRTALGYARAQSPQRMRLSFRELRPMLADRCAYAGSTTGHYFHQDLWAARKVFSARPSRHVDIGSRLDGFVAHILPFVPVEVIDIRQLESGVDGLTFTQEDATLLARIPDNSIESLSSLHAVEHFGLGRYGDPVDPDACFRALGSMARVLRPGGRFYLGVPVGRERLQFNAQRIFDPRTILAELKALSLVSFGAVDDAGNLHPSAEIERARTWSCGCGLFEFTK